jgi:hypothetical protein
VSFLITFSCQFRLTEPRRQLLGIAKNIRHEKVQQRPEFTQIVLQRVPVIRTEFHLMLRTATLSDEFSFLMR